MSKILDVWNKLPHAKQMQLSKQHSIRWYGTTDAQLEWDLENKLPKGLLVADETKEEVLEPNEPAVEVEQEPVVEKEEVAEEIKPRKEARIIEVASEEQIPLTDEEIEEKKKEVKKKKAKK